MNMGAIAESTIGKRVRAPLRAEGRGEQARGPAPSPDRAWKGLAWFGGVLALIGFANAAVYLYPWGFGSREWEFGATAQLLGSLPLPTVGLAMVLAAAVALGTRARLLGIGATLLVLAVGTLVLVGLFWLVVPLALKAPAAAQPLIRQTILRATISGFGFGALYLAGAVFSFRRVTRTNQRS